MPTVEESIYIALPPQEVFNFLSKSENFPVWDSSVVHAETIGDEPVGLGTRAKGTSKIVGKKFDWTLEVGEFQPPGRLVSRSVDGTLEFTVTSTFEPEGDGTRLTYRIDAESGLGGVFGKLADRFVEKAQARTVRANLETLAELLSEHPELGREG
ncbi:carbon monoxide dehydrogenase subunit G [Arthrobacter pascens]|uniref:SRPBCC family protein n=1 Tax=Arthrobacter pascens TaxID=1677 RepID=UPI00279510A3|nr:SRPBCC family protein [Arthrobacter pascens]MDQ0677244.1 carbon monoxide dehydrogenase subunit G [Arthrobacter pascens]